MNKPNIIVAGILNTKGESVRYIAERVKAAGGNPQIMELSLGKECGWADIPLRKVLEPVGVTPEDIFPWIGLAPVNWLRKEQRIQYSDYTVKEEYTGLFPQAEVWEQQLPVL